MSAPFLAPERRVEESFILRSHVVHNRAALGAAASSIVAVDAVGHSSGVSRLLSRYEGGTPVETDAPHEEKERSGRAQGIRTALITWITPFEASTSGRITSASSMKTVPPWSVIVTDWPCAVVALPASTAWSA